MSRRCLLTPDSRSLPPLARRRFCVLSSTPRPALEMYSSRLQSSVTVPSTLSRKECAVGDCAASRRPEMTTTPGAPLSIASIGSPCASGRRNRTFPGCLPERDPTPPAFPNVFVVDRIEQLADQVQPEPPRLTLFDWQPDVDVR